MENAGLISLNFILGLVALIGAASVCLRAIVDTGTVALGMFDRRWLKERLEALPNDEKDVFWVACFLTGTYWWLSFNFKPHLDLHMVGVAFVYILLLYWFRAKLIKRLGVSYGG